MGSFVRGTTPTFTLNVKGSETLDLRIAQNVYFTIEQLGRTLTLSGESLEIEEKTVYCYLSQQDSMSLSTGEARIQLNWTYLDPGGETVRRAATKARSICIDEQLLRQVI